MREGVQAGELGAASACSHRRCIEDPAAMLGGLCGRTARGQPTIHGCGRWFCPWHLHYIVARDGADFRLCARCQRAWERARSAEMLRARRNTRPAAAAPRTIYIVFVAVCLLPPVIVTWPGPSGLAVAALMVIVIFRNGP
jgi:hypothetical protein